MIDIAPINIQEVNKTTANQQKHTFKAKKINELKVFQKKDELQTLMPIDNKSGIISFKGQKHLNKELSVVRKFKNGFGKLTKNVTKKLELLISKNNNPFKKAGVKIEKGIVKTENGELFSGNIEHTTKNGVHILLEYIDGYLVKSSMNFGADKHLQDNFIKTYQRNDNGKIQKIEQEVILVDGNKYLSECKINYFRNGKVRKVVHFNGTSQTFRPNGQISKEILPDGTICYRYDNGQKALEKLPNGTEISWYRDGQIATKSVKNGTSCSLYENGELKKIKLSDGLILEWSEKGQLKTVVIPD